MIRKNSDVLKLSAIRAEEPGEETREGTHPIARAIASQKVHVTG